MPLRRPVRSGGVSPRDRRPHAVLFRGDAAQSEAGGLPAQGGRRHRPRVGRAANRRQYRGPDPVPALRSRRRHHRPFDDEIHWRSWQLDRRRHNRWRQFRLGETRRPFSDAQPARSQLPRRGVDRSGQAAGTHRLYHQGTRDGATRYGYLYEPVQRVLVPAGAGNAAAPHGAPLRERQQGGRVPDQTEKNHPDHLSGHHGG